MKKHVVYATNSFDVCLKEYCMKNNITYRTPNKGDDLYKNVLEYQKSRKHTPIEDGSNRVITVKRQKENIHNKTGIDSAIKKK